MLKKILILCAILLTVVGVYAAAGFYLVPKIARDQLPKLIHDITGQPFKLEAAHFDPFELKADLQGASLLQNDDTPLIRFADLAVDVDVLESIKRRAISLRSVVLREPFFNIERNANGRFNFDDLIEKASKPDEGKKEPNEGGALPLVLIQELKIEQGQIDWTDVPAGQKQTESLQAINFSLSEFSTASDSISPFSLDLKLKSGGGLDLKGEFNLSALSSKGHLKLDDLALRKTWLLFLQQALPIEISDGYGSLNAVYALNAADGADLQLLVDEGGLAIKQLALIEKAKDEVLIQIPSIEVNGIHFDLLKQQIQTNDIEIKQLVLSEKATDEDLVRVSLFDVNGIHVDLLKQQIQISEVSTSDSEIKAWLQADGQINYQSLFASETEGVEPQATETEASDPWQISLDQLSLNNYRIDFTDYSQAKPVEMRLDQLALNVKDYRNVDAQRLPIQLDTRFNQFGHIKLDGDIGLSPFSANFTVDLQGIVLKAFQTYVDPYVNLELADGDFNTRGNLQVKEGDELSVNYQGDANINSLITRDKVKNLDFVKWGNLELKQMTLDVAKQDYKLGRVIFDQPYVRFTKKKDGSNNVSDVMVAKANNPPKVQGADKKSKNAQSSDSPVITIGKIELKQGTSDFADYSLVLPFVVKMNNLDGEVDGFSSDTDNAVKLQLQGKVRDLASVKIAGKYQLQSGDSDISLSFKHLPLPLVTPYMAEFAGYKIEKGQMALDLKYEIKAGQLSAHNKIFIDQLVLGDKVESPKAVSLPLKFAVALLKDANGKINLDFPVTGSLEDPKFSVGSLISDVLANLVTKTVSAPFDAMASLFDTDEDLSTASFAAGSSELTEAEKAKLNQIVKGLQTKPGLVLEIRGAAYQDLDWPVMRYDALVDILKKMKSGELRDKGEKIRSEYIELSNDEYKRLLAKFYAEVFPKKIDYSLFGKPRIKDQPDADFYTVARDELEAVMKPDPVRLNELAVSRADSIVKYLIEQGGIDRNRLYILATDLNNTDSEHGITVQLSLNVAS